MKNTKNNNKTSIFTNIVYAFTAQGISMLFSIIMTLFVPKILGVEGYSFWQLFIFYSSYAGLFQLGMNDGIYLKYGGMDLKDISKKKLNMQLYFEIFFLFLIQIFIFILGSLVSNNNRKFVIVATGIYIIVYNISLFLGYVFQAVNETKIFSKSVMLDRVIYIIALFTIFMCNKFSFKTCIVLFICTRTIMLVYLVFKARNLFIMPHFFITEMLQESWNTMKIGLPLMLANIVAQLILGNVRFFIDHAWGIETFGKCSFAITITNFFLQFIAQISMVLFPILRKLTMEERNKIYEVLRAGLGLVLPLIYICYVPLNFLLRWWLPQYESSLRYLAILLPICIFDSRMNLLCNTYFKVNRYEKVLFKINVFVVVISIMFNLILTINTQNVDFLLYGVTAVIVIRNIVSQKYYEVRQIVGLDDFLIWNIFIAVIFVGVYALFDFKLASVMVLGILLMFYIFNIKKIFRLVKDISLLMEMKEILLQ